MELILDVTSRLPKEQQSINKLMGLTIFGEKVASQIYLAMSELNVSYKPLLCKFAQMEAQHGAWFYEVSRENGIQPDKDFADNELGYLVSQVKQHQKEKNFEALAVVQGFIVESLAIATYESFLSVAHKYKGAHAVFEKALAEEHYHVDWVMRYLRLRFFDAQDEFKQLAEQVNVQGIDCIGGTMMNIAEYLDNIGLSGADCAGAMVDGYTQLLQTVGFEPKQATKHVVSMFMPLFQKYRRGEKTK